MNNSAPKSQSHADQELLNCRLKIDELDGKIVDLLDQRADLVRKIGDLKLANGWPVFDPVREANIFAKVTAQKRSHLSAEDIKAFFNLMIGFFRELESKPRKSISKR